MVFSSLPVYLDPPNWPQQDPQQRAGGGPGEINSQLPSLMPPPPAGGCRGGGPATIKPGVSMAERARIAKLPQPEASLKCPRCESTNTKFCYFNNYNLTQPRHLCKTCRRYWTRGGALRNVPVGGGCRRNKRSKFKSPNTASCSDRQSSSTSTATRSSVSSAGCSADNNMASGSHVQLPAAYHHHQLSFFPHLHNLADFRSASDVAGLDFGQVGNEIESRMGSSFGTQNLSTRFYDQWRATQPLMPPHFPFLAGGLEQFEGGGMVDQPFGYGGSDNKTLLEAGSGAVKLEENHHQQGPNSSRNFLSVPAGNEQYWGSGNGWTDLAAPTSSATHDHS